MRGTDYGLLALFSLVLFGFALVDNRPLTMHEAVLPENAREMSLDRDWLIPKLGGEPWLERPPLPQWLTLGVAGLVGRCNAEWIVRLPAVLAGVVVVLLAAWFAALGFGRTVGLLSGLILATMWEFYTYATDAEADIFLCVLVTGAISLFAYLEYRCRPAGRRENTHFLGRRPWPVLAFFILWGATNLAKGLIFGTLMVAVPVGAFLLGNRDFKALLRYVWLWGWLAFAVAALAWPIAVYSRYPDVLPLWGSDYLGRLNQGFMGEPFWYYGVTLTWVLLPWTLLAVIGLWTSGAPAWRQRYSPERFLWFWAVLTPVVFSIPQGKHHHYLLQCLVPWAVLAALGGLRFRQWLLASPAWMRHPLCGLLLLALPIDLCLAIFSNRIPGPPYLVPALMVLVPVLVFILGWGLNRADGRWALGTTFTILVAAYCLVYSYKTSYLDRYREDTAFLRRLQEFTPPDQPIYVINDLCPLEGFRILFYLGDQARWLHNVTFLRDERIAAREAYVVTRGRNQPQLAGFGSTRVLVQSEYTRGEKSLGDRWTLFQLRFADNRKPLPGNLYINPMQVSGRMLGPFLQEEPRGDSL